MFSFKMTNFSKACAATMVPAAAILGCSLLVAFLIPCGKAVPEEDASEEQISFLDLTDDELSSLVEREGFQLPDASEDDTALALYREPSTRSAVEWFYLRVTGSRDVTRAILEQADKNDIPPSLAFALARAESRFDVRAVNKNRNNSIDRGLFQLNSNSFSKLSEQDFFDPEVNARNGLAHLRFCMGVAGNEVSALAMYNAGTNKVRANSTPQMTLNYIGKIVSYQRRLEKLFAEEVASFYGGDPRVNLGSEVAWKK